jgi:hypothetical protein
MEKEAKRREAAIARMKSENSSKEVPSTSKGSANASKSTWVKNPQ